MLNLFAIEGRLTKDPDSFTAKTGTTIAKCSIAVQESKDVVHFLDFTAFGKTADVIVKWCKKGSLISVNGKITKDSYTTKAGEKRSQIGLIANSVSLLAKAPEKEEVEQRQKRYEQPKNIDSQEMPF